MILPSVFGISSALTQLSPQIFFLGNPVPVADRAGARPAASMGTSLVLEG
jgi:hypothetical protein